MEHSFGTPGPIDLVVVIGSGEVTVEARDVDSTDVEVTGSGAADTVVERRGDEVRVVGPSGPGSLTRRRQEVLVRVRLPRGSRLTTKLGSADLVASGPLGALSAKTGSGSVRVESVDGEATVQSGSGEIEVGDVDGDASVSSGSGVVRLGSTHGDVKARSGSGDLRVDDAGHDVALRTGSGSITVDRVRRGAVLASTGSGDVRIGVPVGLPVWTDITSGSGRVHSDLEPVGEPGDGQDYLEIRARTGSGSVLLEQRDAAVS